MISHCLLEPWSLQKYFALFLFFHPLLIKSLVIYVLWYMPTAFMRISWHNLFIYIERLHRRQKRPRNRFTWHSNTQSSGEFILPRNEKVWNQREEAPSRRVEDPIQVLLKHFLISTDTAKWENKLFFMQNRQKIGFPSPLCQEWILCFPRKSSWQ